jgi:hypothetical protein
MKYFFVFILFIIPILIKGQDNSNNKTELYFKYSPLSLLGDGVTNSIGIQLGLEYKLKNQIGIQQDIMYIFLFSHKNQNFFTINVNNINGIRSITELRFYLNKENQHLEGIYIAPQLIYQYTKAIRTQSLVNQDVNEYCIKRNVIAFHGKLGWQLVNKCRFILDVSCGVGLRYIASFNSGKIPDHSIDYEFPYSKDYDSGSKIFPSFIMALNIGWMF